MSHVILGITRDSWRAGGEERVVVIHRSHSQLQPGDTEVTRRSATVWNVRDGRVASVEFNVPYNEAFSSVGMVV